MTTKRQASPTAYGHTEVCVRCGLGWRGRETKPNDHAYTSKGPMHFSCRHQWIRELQRLTDPILRAMLITEAVTSVALSHPKGCSCTTCMAASRDPRALGEIMEALAASSSEGAQRS